jgi:hypothetical protein
METNVQITPGKLLEELASIKEPKYSSGNDFIVLALHGIMKINGFVLVGLSEDENYVGRTLINKEFSYFLYHSSLFTLFRK